MKSKMASKFAFKNMKANALLLTPFLIASSIMGTLFFVMASLGQNQYIEKNHEYIAMLIQFGIFIVGIFMPIAFWLRGEIRNLLYMEF